MTEYSYRTLNVYKDAKALVVEVYRLLKQYLVEEKFALCDQIRRAAISITSNIAEGMRRYSDKEKAHFFGDSLCIYDGSREPAGCISGARVYYEATV